MNITQEGEAYEEFKKKFPIWAKMRQDVKRVVYTPGEFKINKEDEHKNRTDTTKRKSNPS